MGEKGGRRRRKRRQGTMRALIKPVSGTGPEAGSKAAFSVNLCPLWPRGKENIFVFMNPWPDSGRVGGPRFVFVSPQLTLGRNDHCAKMTYLGMACSVSHSRFS